MRQARIVETKLGERVRECSYGIKTIPSQADRHPQQPLAAMGGEGVFVKELEAALLEGTIDCAVHSMKDLPLETPESLRICAVLEREEPRDALVSRAGESFERLAKGARIGTSSVRRRSQLRRRRRDLEFLEIRGNVDTRLRKLDEGQYDAIVVAACGLIRLGLEERITEPLDLVNMLPEPGQGALAIEVRERDCDLFSALDDPLSRACVEAERAFLRALGGGCRVPIAAYASCHDGDIQLEGAVIAADGSAEVRGTLAGSMAEPVALGDRLASQLASQGAKELL